MDVYSKWLVTTNNTVNHLLISVKQLRYNTPEVCESADRYEYYVQQCQYCVGKYHCASLKFG